MVYGDDKVFKEGSNRKEVNMKLELIMAFEKLNDYLNYSVLDEATWEHAMISPFWNELSRWAPFPVDYLKPIVNMSREQAKEQLKMLQDIEWENYLKEFEGIVKALPKEDEDPMQIAIYPSLTDIVEGVYGTGVWGNVILNVNPTNKSYLDWLSFIFAHEYHHNVWGDYWYCKKGGEGLHNTFLEKIVIEGEADFFAMSLHKDKNPSWHYGVTKEEEKYLWDKMKPVLNASLSPEDTAKYMFGCKELGIPKHAGYFCGIRIVEAYIRKHSLITQEELLATSPYEIYNDVAVLFR